MEKKIKNIIIISTEFQSIDIFLGKMINRLSNKNNILLICNNIYEETRNINLNNTIRDCIECIENISIWKRGNY